MSFEHPPFPELTESFTDVHPKVLAMPPVESIEMQFTNACQLQDTLGRCSDALRANAEAQLPTLSPEQQQHARTLFDVLRMDYDGRLESELDAALATCGLDASNAWTVDMLYRLAAGRPVMFHAVTARAAAGPDALTAWEQGRVSAEQAGLQGVEVGRVAQELLELQFANGAQAFDIDDISGDGRRRWMYTGQAIALLQKAAALPVGLPGEDYFINLHSHLDKLTLALDEHLYSGSGLVLRTGEGADQSVSFRFKDATTARMYSTSPEQYEALLDKGILLREPDGTPTPTALKVAALLDKVNTDYMHVFIADARERRAYEEALLLLSTIDPVYATLIRPIYIDAQKLSPEAAAYGIARRWELGAGKLQNNLGKFGQVPGMTVADGLRYLREEYGDDEPEPLDDKTLSWLMGLLPKIFPGGITGNVRADCYGQYTPIVHALAAYMTGRDARIIAADTSPDNLSIVAGLQSGSLLLPNGQPDTTALAIGPNFERFMVKHGGEKYEGSYAELLRRLVTEQTSIADAPPNSCQVRVDSYGSYASTWRFEDFYRFAAAGARSLVPGGIAISAYLTGKEQWRSWPATPVLERHIREAHAAAGMDIIDMLIIPPSPGDAAKGHVTPVIVVVARRANYDSPFRPDTRPYVQATT